jgi:hypothetical protein
LPAFDEVVVRLFTGDFIALPEDTFGVVAELLSVPTRGVAKAGVDAPTQPR